MLVWFRVLIIGGILSPSTFGWVPPISITLDISRSCRVSKASCGSSTLQAFLSSPEDRQRSFRRSVSPIKLFGQKKRRVLTRDQQVPSLLRFFLSIVCRNNVECESTLKYLEFKKKNNIIETGVETALVLGDEKRRKQWIHDVSKQFSWIPPEILSTCVDGLAAAFGAIAPRDLKRALRPGGLEKTRSKIETDVVRNLARQPIIRNLPLPSDDKKKLLVHLVDLSLDFFLKDVETAMAAPSSKLQLLDLEREEIKKYMSLWQIAWYRLRHRPRSTIVVGLVSVWAMYASFLLYGQKYATNVLCPEPIKSAATFLSGVCAQTLYGVKYYLLKLSLR